MKVPEHCRVTPRLAPQSIYASTSEDGNNGAFRIPHPRITGYLFICLVSDQFGWEHVSVSLKNGGKPVKRCPTWEEMCFIKDQFWNEGEAYVQYHPAKSEHVNVHPFCLHLWRPTDATLPAPPSIMVG